MTAKILAFEPNVESAFISRSISGSVRYSRSLTWAFGTRRGGTFPFTGVGRLSAEGSKASIFAVMLCSTFP